VSASGEKYSLNASGGWPERIKSFAPSDEMSSTTHGASGSPKAGHPAANRHRFVLMRAHELRK
jgi:hypothetical protein